MNSEKWDRHFLGKALFNASMSKDPRRKVGSVIVDEDRIDVASGFNGFPRGIADTRERLDDRDMKLRLIVHAEMNAVLSAARKGTALKGCTLYVAGINKEGVIWGGPPCTRCTVELLQTGIARVVSIPAMEGTQWAADLRCARDLLSEAGVHYDEYKVNHDLEHLASMLNF